MPTFLSEEQKSIDLAISMSFIDTVIDNVSYDLHKVRKQYKENEIIGTEAISYAANTMGKNDEYPVEHIVTDQHGHKCSITTEWLYQAICNLDERQKEVLILKFWYGKPSQNIARMLGVTVRTIYNWQQEAYNSIRCCYERSITGNDKEKY